jgi:hypothetical protein
LDLIKYFKKSTFDPSQISMLIEKGRTNEKVRRTKTERPLLQSFTFISGSAPSGGFPFSGTELRRHFYEPICESHFGVKNARIATG